MVLKQITKQVLSFAHLNLRSVFTGFAEFTNIIQNNDFDVVGVTETWLTNKTSSDVVSVPGYNFYRKDRGRGRGGGVGFYIKKSLKCENLSFDNLILPDGYEHYWMRIKINHKLSMSVGVIYRVGNNVLECVNILDSLLPEILPMDEYILVLGDLNINMINIHNPVNKLFDSYDFYQVIDEPTRLSGATATLLDPIFINDKNVVSQSGTKDSNGVSDHLLTFCKINISCIKKFEKFLTRRDFKNFEERDFLFDLQSIVRWDDLYYVHDIDSKVEYLTKNIKSLFDKHAPLRSIRVTKPHAPWLTYGIRSLMRERDHARLKFKKENTAESLVNYKMLRNLTKTSIRREKLAYLEYLEKQKDQRKVWNTLKDLNVYMPTNTISEIPAELSNVEEINEYFCSVFQKTNNCDSKIIHYNNSRRKEGIHFSLKLVDPSDICKYINSIKSNAAGIDGITLQMVKQSLHVIILHITHIVNSCLEHGHFPNPWKQSLVSPLPKKHDPVNFSDLRPVSLLPVVSKILERVVHVQVTEYFDKNGLFPVHQSGFRANHSTTTALLNITDNIVKIRDKNMAAILILLDYSKAFDVIDHELMCAKLTFYGFDEAAVLFFRSYLSGRGQVVGLGGNTSQSKQIISGVPQGSILGPLLYVIYTSDMFSTVSNSHLQSYADDTQLLFQFDPDYPDTASELLNLELGNILKYSMEHNLKINSSKTTMLLFCPENKRNTLMNRLIIQIDNNRLTFANCGRNLGLYMDIHLNFDQHLKSMLKRSYVKMKLLYANRHLLNYKTRKKLCESLIMSIYSYCFIVYYPFLHVANKKRIQYVQNTCCRFVCGLRKYDHVSANIKKLGWLKCDNQYKYNFTLFSKKLNMHKQPIYLFEKLVYREAIHNRALRDRNYLTMPQHRTSFFQKSFIYNCVFLYNRMPKKFKDCDFRNLKFGYKIYLLDSQ